MVRSARHGYDEQCLDQHRDAECVHGETGCVDLEAKDVDHTLSLFRVVGLEQGREAPRWSDGRQRSLARRSVVAEKNAILAGELFEGDRYEGADTAYDKDLSKSTRQLMVMVVVNLRSK